MIIIGNQPEEQVVLVSLEDFQAMEETAYLLSSPANRRHLERSLQEADKGEVIEFPVEDL
jgi:antitoxin YefM